MSLFDPSSSTFGGATSNGNFSSLPPYSAVSVQSQQHQAPYPASANPFLDDDDNVDSLSSPHHSSHQSPPSGGYSSHENSAGAPVRALYDYEAQEQDELSFKQGKFSTPWASSSFSGCFLARWCIYQVGRWRWSRLVYGTGGQSRRSLSSHLCWDTLRRTADLIGSLSIICLQTNSNSIPNHQYISFSFHSCLSCEHRSRAVSLSFSLFVPCALPLHRIISLFVRSFIQFLSSWHRKRSILCTKSEKSTENYLFFLSNYFLFIVIRHCIDILSVLRRLRLLAGRENN